MVFAALRQAQFSAFLHHLVHHFFFSLWRCRKPGDDFAGKSGAGRGRRRLATAFARDSSGKFSAGETWRGHGPLRAWRCRRSRARSNSRREGAVQEAQAQLDQAELNLSYTTIVAPVDGIIDEKTVELSQRVQPGEQMFVISQIDDIWITADFKETQLRKMHAGQQVDISVDAYKGKLHGYVENAGSHRRGHQPAST